MSCNDRNVARLARAVVAAGAMMLVFAGLPGRAQEPAVIEQHAQDLAIGVCGTCHGPDGNSINPMFPRLAGQHADYLVRQLKSFKGETRGDPYAIAYMWGMASGLSDETIDALGQYYAQQKTGPGKIMMRRRSPAGATSSSMAFPRKAFLRARRAMASMRSATTCSRGSRGSMPSTF